MDNDRAHWEPLAQDRIDETGQCFDTLRGIDGYYLRTAAISLSEGVVLAPLIAT